MVKKMEGTGKLQVKVGKTEINITYRYQNLSEKTIHEYNKMVAERRK